MEEAPKEDIIIEETTQKEEEAPKGEGVKEKTPKTKNRITPTLAAGIILAGIACLMLVVGATYFALNSRANKEKGTSEENTATLQQESGASQDQATASAAPGEDEPSLCSSCGQGTSDSTPSATPEPEASPSAVACASTLTAADEIEIARWKTIENDTYHYSFKYPQTWEIEVQEDDLISIQDTTAQINVRFGSDTMSAAGLEEGVKKDSEETVQIACGDAHKVSFSGDPTVDPGSENKRLIWVTFTKSGVPHLIMFSYTYEGASVSGDIVEAFNLFLKTITFD